MFNTLYKDYMAFSQKVCFYNFIWRNDWLFSASWRKKTAPGLVLLNLIIINCNISDPDYLKKPLLNITHTGFISKELFQVVVEVPILTNEMTILKEREICNQKAVQERDKITIPLLRAIASTSQKNKSREAPSYRNYKSIIKEYQVSRGEFSWFLDSMFIFLEDYSSRDKCTFVYRLLQEDLYAKVEGTKLVLPDESKKEKNKYIDPSSPNPSTQQTPGQNSNSPVIPGVIR